MSRFDADLLEGFDMDSESEASEGADASEAVRRRVRVASGQGIVRPRPAGGNSFVNRIEFQAAMARVGDQIKKNSDAVLTVNAKTAALLAAAKKEATERKKQSEGSNKDINSKLQMLTLLPLLMKTPTASLNNVSGTNPDGSTLAVGTAINVSTPDPSPLDAILPLLLVSGMGTGSGGLGFGGDSSSGSDNGMMMMLVLALALSGGLGK